jgi:glycosyltransferase involved in cell wall biosynthesis
MSRIAFFTLNAYDMLTGGHEGDAVGGAQVQQILIGKELDSRGHQVYFVEYDTEHKDQQTIDGIEVVTKPLPTGSELSRALIVARGTRNIINRIDPDVCYRRSLDFEILPLSLYSSLTETRFVYGIAHDDELTDTPHKLDSGLKSMGLYRWLNRQALSNGDAVIAQNPTQYELAVEQLDTDVYQIPNCYRAGNVDSIDWEFESPVVFWAARFEPWKQPELVADLAESLPEVTFVMAGGPGDKELFSELQRREAEIENLVVLGHIPFSEIDRYFAAADIFLNTSKSEGFPNTFLQAWAQATPVASLQVDPNDILSSRGIGIVGDGSINTLQSRMARLIEDENKLINLGKASKEYLDKYHTVKAITDRYERVLTG